MKCGGGLYDNGGITMKCTEVWEWGWYGVARYGWIGLLWITLEVFLPGF